MILKYIQNTVEIIFNTQNYNFLIQKCFKLIVCFELNCQNMFFMGKIANTRQKITQFKGI